MLSRIARGLCAMGRSVERAKTVARVLEVSHKMNLEREAVDDSGNIWVAIAEQFGVTASDPTEEAIYADLVVSRTHPYSVGRCIETLRSQGRGVRDHISEELWGHLNQYFLAAGNPGFDQIVAMGRSDFNQRIATFCDAFHGLADDTMIHGESWQFLRVGRFSERAELICKILDVKRKALALAPETRDRPVAFHHWQALLRSLSGWEPYRRAHDARIVPERVLDFVLRAPEFPYSLGFGLDALAQALAQVTSNSPAQNRLARDIDALLAEIRALDCSRAIAEDRLEDTVRRLADGCRAISGAIEAAYFDRLDPAPQPLGDGRSLVPQ